MPFKQCPSNNALRTMPFLKGSEMHTMDPRELQANRISLKHTSKLCIQEQLHGSRHIHMFPSDQLCLQENYPNQTHPLLPLFPCLCYLTGDSLTCKTFIVRMLCTFNCIC